MAVDAAKETLRAEMRTLGSQVAMVEKEVVLLRQAISAPRHWLGARFTNVIDRSLIVMLAVSIGFFMERVLS